MTEKNVTPPTDPLPPAYINGGGQWYTNGVPGNIPPVPGAIPGTPLPQQTEYQPPPPTHQPPPAYQQNGFYEPNPYNRQPARTCSLKYYVFPIINLIKFVTDNTMVRSLSA